MAFACKNRKLRQCSTVHLHRDAQFRGVGCTRISQLNSAMIERLSEFNDTIANRFIKMKRLAMVIQQLDSYSADANFPTDQCMHTLEEIYGNITNFEARSSNDEQQEKRRQCHYARTFVEYGGVQIFIRLLMHNSIIASQRNPDTEPQLCVKSLILEIFSRFISMNVGEDLSREMTQHDDILSYVFTLLRQEKTCLTACQFIEDLLQARREVINLSTIGNLRDLVNILDDRMMANFCRILSITISDLDIYENKSSLFAQNKQKRTKGFVNVRDLNQELLLNIPELLPRLINIACAQKYVPRYPGMDSELACWMEWIDNAMADDIYDTPDTDMDTVDKFIGGLCAPLVRGGPLVQMSGLRISNALILRVHVVYVLGLFLVGKHRKKVQRKLAELRLVPGLSELFDQFIWKCQSHRDDAQHRLRGHNASCECSPEVALKIQFLRLVHSFCDHSEYRHLLLSKSELNEIKWINCQAGSLEINALDSINKSLMCSGNRGLLTKIVDVMKKEPTTSTFRFWLARAVESYLRGSTSFCDQVFLLRRGLLQHIVRNIIDHDMQPKEILQSSFDLIGELVKFNVDSFSVFDKILNTKQRLDKFLVTAHKNLVDSNMFIRSLVLSSEHFRRVRHNRDYKHTESLLLTHIGRFDQQVAYLSKLISLVNVHNLTQENVSCLNTTLVFMMFANQKGQLPQYLRALSTPCRGSSLGGAAGVLSTTSTGQTVMKNFRDLLLFWQDHYLHKDKDCSALEKSSRISFDYWKQTVNALVCEDRSQRTSVLHYMESGDCLRDCRDKVTQLEARVKMVASRVASETRGQESISAVSMGSVLDWEKAEIS